MTNTPRPPQHVQFYDAPKRNDPCPCGSGKKFKVCCLAKQKAAHEANAKLWKQFASKVYDDAKAAVNRFKRDGAAAQFTEDETMGLAVVRNVPWEIDSSRALEGKLSIRLKYPVKLIVENGQLGISVGFANGETPPPELQSHHEP